MRVVCPSCNAAYNVPEASLSGAPRRLRCARCQTEWTVEPPAPPPAADDRPGPMARMAEASLAERAAGAEAASPPAPSSPAVREGLAPASTGSPPGLTGSGGKGHAAIAAQSPTAQDGLPSGTDAASVSATRVDGTNAPLVADAKLQVSRGADLDRPGGRRGPELSAEDRLAAQARARVRAQNAATTGNVVLAWLLSLAVLALCVAAAVIWRKEVVHAWPPSERVYLWFGLR